MLKVKVVTNEKKRSTEDKFDFFKQKFGLLLACARANTYIIKKIALAVAQQSC